MDTLRGLLFLIAAVLVIRPAYGGEMGRAGVAPRDRIVTSSPDTASDDCAESPAEATIIVVVVVVAAFFLALPVSDSIESGRAR